MNKRIWIGGALGGLVYFIWGAVSWMVLPWHNTTMRALPAEPVVVDALKSQALERGVYYFPAWPEDPSEEAMKSFESRHEAGPIGVLVYQPGGLPTMAPAVFAKSIFFDVLAALLISVLLSRNTATVGYVGRVACVALAGLFAGLVSHLSYWTWMHFPTDYTLVMVADLVVGWTLAGLVIAAAVKPAAGGRPSYTLSGVVDPG